MPINLQQQQQCMRYVLWFCTIITTIWTYVEVTGCKFMRLGLGKNKTNMIQLGFFGRTFEENEEALGCLRYSTSLKDDVVTDTFVLGRVFGVLALILYTTAMILISWIMLFKLPHRNIDKKNKSNKTNTYNDKTINHHVQNNGYAEYQSQSQYRSHIHSQSQSEFQSQSLQQSQRPHSTTGTTTSTEANKKKKQRCWQLRTNTLWFIAIRGLMVASCICHFILFAIFATGNCEQLKASTLKELGLPLTSSSEHQFAIQFDFPVETSCSLGSTGKLAICNSVLGCVCIVLSWMIKSPPPHPLLQWYKEQQEEKEEGKFQENEEEEEQQSLENRNNNVNHATTNSRSVSYANGRHSNTGYSNGQSYRYSQAKGPIIETREDHNDEISSIPFDETVTTNPGYTQFPQEQQSSAYGTYVSREPLLQQRRLQQQLLERQQRQEIEEARRQQALAKQAQAASHTRQQQQQEQRQWQGPRQQGQEREQQQSHQDDQQKLEPKRKRIVRWCVWVLSIVSTILTLVETLDCRFLKLGIQTADRSVDYVEMGLFSWRLKTAENEALGCVRYTEFQNREIIANTPTIVSRVFASMTILLLLIGTLLLTFIMFYLQRHPRRAWQITIVIFCLALFTQFFIFFIFASRNCDEMTGAELAEFNLSLDYVVQGSGTLLVDTACAWGVDCIVALINTVVLCYIVVLLFVLKSPQYPLLVLQPKIAAINDRKKREKATRAAANNNNNNNINNNNTSSRPTNPTDSGNTHPDQEQINRVGSSPSTPPVRSVAGDAEVGDTISAMTPGQSSIYTNPNNVSYERFKNAHRDESDVFAGDDFEWVDGAFSPPRIIRQDKVKRDSQKTSPISSSVRIRPSSSAEAAVATTSNSEIGSPAQPIQNSQNAVTPTTKNIAVDDSLNSSGYVVMVRTESLKDSRKIIRELIHPDGSKTVTVTHETFELQDDLEDEEDNLEDVGQMIYPELDSDDGDDIRSPYTAEEDYSGAGGTNNDNDDGDDDDTSFGQSARSR